MEPLSAKSVRGSELLAVALGGVLGSLARYGISEAVPHHRGEFGIATMIINISGCFFIGVLMAVLDQKPQASHLVRPFLGVGVSGGFTTFSTYVLETVDSVATHRPVIAVLYGVISLIGSLSAVIAGIAFTRAAQRS